jgi:hypothetical protein
MSDQQLTNQEPLPKKKHAGGRPRKPKPAPPLPPPEPRSLEETVLMGDHAALKASASAQLRWISERAQLLKDIQARDDADRHDELEIDNKRLRERVQALESTRQKLENELGKKDRDLAAVQAENDKMATNLKEMIDEHAKQLGELTDDMRASERKAQGLLAFVRCACLQMKDHSGGRRIEYAAQLMHFSKQAFKEARRLAELVKDPEDHRAHYSSRYWDLRQDPGGHGLAPEQFAHLMTSRKQAIERSMQADRERLAIELSNVIPDEVMNRAFELLSVTREEVVRQLDAKQQEGKK